MLVFEYMLQQIGAASVEDFQQIQLTQAVDHAQAI